MGIRCATERKCGELANTGSKVGFLGAIAIASDPGMVKTLGNILPEVMVGVEPGLTPKSALFFYRGGIKKPDASTGVLNAQDDCICLRMK